MSVKEFAKHLEDRALRFAVRIIHLSLMLPNTPEPRVMRTQMTKSGTSVGANYREANRSRSKSDFHNKIAICESEASETLYWLDVVRQAQWLTWEQLKPVYDECNELLALFTSIGKSK